MAFVVFKLFVEGGDYAQFSSAFIRSASLTASSNVMSQKGRNTPILLEGFASCRPSHVPQHLPQHHLGFPMLPPCVPDVRIDVAKG
jgi:hypothetical protein